MSQLGNTGAPTPRRSTRLSTKASSIAGESAITNVTNGGTRQRRKGPLTKVKARKSNAYGASGRVGAAEALSVSATGFAQAFQNQRGDAFARDQDEEEEEEEDDVDELGVETPMMSGALNGNSHEQGLSPIRQGHSRIRRDLSFLDSEEVTPSDDDLATSLANTSKSFGMNHEGGMLYSHRGQEMQTPPQVDANSTPLFAKSTARRTFQSRTQMQTQTPLLAQTQGRLNPKQASAQVQPEDREGIDKSVENLVAAEQARLRNKLPTAQPEQQSKQRQQHLNNPKAVNEWLGSVEPHREDKDEKEWHGKKYLPWALWALLAAAILGLIVSAALSSSSSTTMPGLTTGPGMTEAVTARISRVWYSVADTIMPRGYLGGNGTYNDDALWSLDRKLNDKFSGRFEAMDHSLKELKEELPQVLIVRRYPDGRREISDEFWNALLSKVNSQGNDAEWTNFLQKNRKKLNDIFNNPMGADSSKISPEAVSRQEFVDLMQQHYKSISTRVDESVSQAIRSQSEKIKATMMSQLHLMALAQTNLVANYETNIGKANYFSPGVGAYILPSLTSATFLDNPTVFAKFALALGAIPQRNPPKAALTKWEEPGDCWCSAPDAQRKGQAQLAVALGRPMIPNQITIEHVPMKMVPSANIENAPRDVELWVETDEPVTFRYSHMENQCQPGPAGWKCVGVFKYNIHANNYVQTFDLDATTTAPISKAMVRVVTNWGADHTCLYRLRLHGDAMEQHEYTTFLNSPVA